MANFTFLQEEWPQIFRDCAAAESYVFSDPRGACFYSRRAAEVLVNHLYDLEKLPAPYRSDFSAHLNEPAFKRCVGQSIYLKLNLLRKVGNEAVHSNTEVSGRQALMVVRELHHIMVWAAYAYSTQPDAVPMGRPFDPELAKRAAPLSQKEIVRLAQKFEEQDREHARRLEEHAEALAAKDAEIEELRRQVQAAQEAKTASFDHDLDEAATRDAYIDLLLHEAGWPLADARDREFPVEGLPTPSGTGRADYVLWSDEDVPLAVIEAKRTQASPARGQEQARLYADALEKAFGTRPVIFFTNGAEHWIWDDAAGYPPRRIQGFRTRDELELLIQRRGTQRALASAEGESGSIDTAIAGRPYQLSAISAVNTAFQDRQREALLVMATGTGKTRTVIALVKQLMKANWVKRVLFLADRTALVTQAVNAFKEHLPEATTVNLITDPDSDGRIYASTYPTMLNRLQDRDAASGIRTFGPGFFDLVVIDEAHRSVYAKYGFLFEYFDSLLVGLTATPKDEVDYNTYRLFNLEDRMPTDAYPLDEAISDGWLVPYIGYSVGTKFTRQGIRYDDLSDEEKKQWDLLDWGEDGAPDSVTSDELNRWLFNADTIDKMLARLMTDGRKVAGGDLLGKTIIFAKNQHHAEFIQERFDRNWPEYGGRFARVITHSVTYAQSLIDDFSSPTEFPQIAISVDMLDTGIDVPDIVNLVFLKPVFSKSKFWQMVGRGTRLRPDLYGPGQDKEDFAIFDYCGNLEYFGQESAGRESQVQRSLTARLVEARVGLVAELDRRSAGNTDLSPALRHATVEVLHSFVEGMSLDNVLVRPHRREVERFAQREAWAAPLSEDAAEAVVALADLPSAAVAGDEDAKRFDLALLRGQLARLDDDQKGVDRTRGLVQELAAALLADAIAVPAVGAQADLLDALTDDAWWADVTVEQLEDVRVRMRGLVRFLERRRQAPIHTDFADEQLDSVEVTLPQATPGMDFARFTEKARRFLAGREEHMTIQRLRRNRQLTEEDLRQLQEILVEAGGDDGLLGQAQEEAGDLGTFVRSLVGLDRAAAQEEFAQFLEKGTHTSSQIKFVQMIVADLTRNGNVSPDRFYAAPYTRVAATGPEQLFEAEELESIRARLASIRARAVPGGAADGPDEASEEEASIA
jgi:type I restriction enzyme R subunit